jgi:uncharacterized membrane-anchored protein
MTTQEEAKRQAEQVSGVSNVAYDLMVVLTNKLEGIAALEEYKLDAAEARDRPVLTLFDRLEERMHEDVGQLRELLTERLQPATPFVEDTIAVAQDEIG